VSYEEYLNWILKDETKVFENYPNLKALSEKVCKIQTIAKWIEERPKSKYLLKNEKNL
jgi:hypothetical protein